MYNFKDFFFRAYYLDLAQRFAREREANPNIVDNRLLTFGTHDILKQRECLWGSALRETALPSSS